MQTLKLSAVHRILVLSMLDEEGKNGGSLSEINKLLKMVERFDFSSEERKELNLRSENGNVMWNIRKDNNPEDELVDVEKEIEISDEQCEKLKEIFKKKDAAKSFTTVNVGPVFQLAEQIGYKFE